MKIMEGKKINKNSLNFSEIFNDLTAKSQQESGQN